MASLSEQQVLGMLFDEDFDSGGESDIEEDIAFPLPREIEHSPSPSPPPESPLYDHSSPEIEQRERESQRGRGRGRGRSRGVGRGRGRGRSRGRGRGRGMTGRERSQDRDTHSHTRDRSPLREGESASGRHWIEVDPNNDIEPVHIQFTQSVGPQLPDMCSQTPADFFHLFFTNDLLDLLVRKTNSYAELRIQALQNAGSLAPQSRFHKWKDVTRVEMWGFLALIVNMGIIQLPDIKSYWKRSWACQVPFFRDVLRRDRFQEIFWMLHVGTPGITPRKIDKIKPLLDLLLPRFQDLYHPSQHLSIDETMVGFRGRFGSIQYMPQKPTKWGIKAFTLADAANGYLLNSLVYTGAQTLEHADPSYQSLPQPAQLVMDLMRERYLNKGYHLFTDRYYTSIPLTDVLLNKETVFTGTAMKNRKELPTPIRDKQFSLSPGETRCFRDGRLMALAWRAESKKKPLIMVSSSCSAKPVTISTRRGQVSKPSVVNAYNCSMNGVDVADQLTVFYSFVRKTRKWWRKLFFYMTEVSIVNSYLLYKLTVTQPRSHVAYRRAMVEQMAKLSIQQGPPRPGPGAPRRAVVT